MTGGKYDKHCERILREENARSVLVIVDGPRGRGFSVSTSVTIPPSLLAKILRGIADQLEASAS